MYMNFSVFREHREVRIGNRYANYWITIVRIRELGITLGLSGHTRALVEPLSSTQAQFFSFAAVSGRSTQYGKGHHRSRILLFQAGRSRVFYRPFVVHLLEAELKELRDTQLLAAERISLFLLTACLRKRFCKVTPFAKPKVEIPRT